MMKRKYSALLAVAGAAVMLGGCNIYRPYSRPQMETAGLYRDTVSVTDTLSGDTVNFGNRPWQEVFTDPKLQSLIEQGLSSNIDLLSAALVVQECRNCVNHLYTVRILQSFFKLVHIHTVSLNSNADKFSLICSERIKTSYKAWTFNDNLVTLI